MDHMAHAAPRYRVEGASQVWEGALDELLEANPDFNEFIAHRLERLPVGDAIQPSLGPEEFKITRVS